MSNEQENYEIEVPDPTATEAAHAEGSASDEPDASEASHHHG
jgi:hypothetical protein